MLAKLIALVVVAVAIGWPAVFLLRLAWLERGLARKVAIVFLVLSFILVTWLVAPEVEGETREDRISDFIGAVGILTASGGVLAILATLFGRFRVKPPSDEH